MTSGLNTMVPTRLRLRVSGEKHRPDVGAGCPPLHCGPSIEAFGAVVVDGLLSFALIMDDGRVYMRLVAVGVQQLNAP